MSEEDKNKINILIDQKLQELEDTGLSRQEILTNGKQTGIPLSQDSFFQYIKSNKDARYVYLSPNEEYTVNKIIDLALRQDIGTDQFNAQSGKYENLMKLKRSRFQKDTFVNTKNPLENVNELIRDEVIYHPKVYQKKQLRQQRLRRINNYDVHWRNTEYLIQFLNKSSKIRNRYQTYLSNQQQKKVGRTIDVARHMLLLPFTAAILPYHKRSLKSLQSDIEDFTRRKINIRTGQLYQETELQKKERSVESLTLDEDYELHSSIERPKEIDSLIVKGRIHAEKLKCQKFGLTLTEEKKAELFDSDLVNFRAIRQEELIKEEMIKNAESADFSSEYQQIKNIGESIPTHYLAQAIISEQTLNVEKLQELSISKKEHMNKEESLKIINEIRRKGGLSALQI